MKGMMGHRTASSKKHHKKKKIERNMKYKGKSGKSMNYGGSGIINSASKRY